MINFQDYKRIVIKIGSSLIVDSQNNNLRVIFLKNLAKDIKQLKKIGIEVVIVTSGAMACGCNDLRINRRLDNLDQMQALSAFGQVILIEHFKKQFAKYGMNIAQMLITGEDCQKRKQYLNIRTTIENLFALNIIPIINENDSTATEEIRFGDNDNLSAQTAQLINADLLIILSDVAGLYDKNPKTNQDAKIISEISEITPKIINMAKTETSYFGTGGMASKIKAAKIAMQGGTNVIITEGRKKNAVLGMAKHKEYSLFKASTKPISARKKWLSNLKPSSSITIDSGAAKAIQKKNSLLPVGVIKYSGEFARGDTVRLITEKNKIIAVGMSSISSKELFGIIGLSTTEIVNKAKYPARSIVVHYDNLVLKQL